MYMISSEIPIFTFIENKNVINVKFMIKKKNNFPHSNHETLSGVSSGFIHLHTKSFVQFH